MAMRRHGGQVTGAQRFHEQPCVTICHSKHTPMTTTHGTHGPARTWQCRAQDVQLAVHACTIPCKNTDTHQRHLPLGKCCRGHLWGTSAAETQHVLVGWTPRQRPQRASRANRAVQSAVAAGATSDHRAEHAAARRNEQKLDGTLLLDRRVRHPRVNQRRAFHIA